MTSARKSPDATGASSASRTVFAIRTQADMTPARSIGEESARVMQRLSASRTEAA